MLSIQNYQIKQTKSSYLDNINKKFDMLKVVTSLHIKDRIR